MNKICIYHANCFDGLAAAFAVSLKFKNNIDFHPSNHGDPIPNITNKDVIMVDFSYKRNDIISISEKTNSILIIDHHKTAKEELVNLPNNVKVIFNNNKSGCVLSWEYFHPNKEIPTLLLHIQDRDLWEYKLENTKEIISGLNLYSNNNDIETFGEILYNISLEKLYSDGVVLNLQHIKNIKQHIQNSAYLDEIYGYTIPMINVPPIWSSDACHIMANMKKEYPFAACYYDDENYRNFSLRSLEDGIDVSEIATFFGGGGHKHAAGFKIKL